MGQRIGPLVGAVGGLVFVVVDAGALSAAALPLRVLGVVAVLVGARMLARALEHPDPTPV